MSKTSLLSNLESLKDFTFKTGKLYKQGDPVKNWKELFFKLKRNGLYYYEINSKGQAGREEGVIPFEPIKGNIDAIQQVGILVKNRTQQVISIKLPLREYLLYADSMIDSNDWFKSIRQALSMFSEKQSEKLSDHNEQLIATTPILDIDWNDREQVLKAIKEDPHSLKYAPEELKKDRKFIIQAVKQNGYSHVYADKSLIKDRSFILEVAQISGVQFHFPEDREIVLAGVKKLPFNAKRMDEKLKNDRNFILQVVRTNGYALKYLDDPYKKDREIVMEAVKQNGSSLDGADVSLKKDREIVYQAVKQRGSSLYYADQSFHSDLPLFYMYYLDAWEVAHHLNAKLFDVLEKSKKESLSTKLSKNLLDLYSNDFLEESSLYWNFQLQDCISESKRAVRLFSNPMYSPQFAEKMIILQIVKKIISKNSTVSESTEANIDFYLFALRLDKFLQDLQLSQTSRNNLKKVVESSVLKFDVSRYSPKEVASIMYFLKEWTKDYDTFENYKEIFTKYNQLGREFKIIDTINRYYYKLKNDITLLSMLGYGGEGIVFRAYSNKFNSLVAFKIKFEREDDEQISNERVEFIKRSDIKGKIKCFDSGLIDNYLYSIMELGEETVSDYIERNKEIYGTSSMSKEKLIEVLTVFMKILDSVQSIHDNNIAHRDLDPKNIVKVRDDYKIIDFETARVVKTGNSITLMIGKEAYMSPEVSSHNYEEASLNYQDKIGCNNGQITTSCDLFSLGCILLKLLTNCPLRLDKEFVCDSNFQNYASDYCYFNVYGNFFHQVITTFEGEMKLHHAIGNLINYDINPIFQVNEYLIRCVLTMIQRDSSQRLDCFTHKVLIKDIIELLKSSNKSESIEKIGKHMELYKNIIPLKSFSSIMEDSEMLKKNSKKIEDELRTKLEETEQENKILLQRIKELEEQVRMLKNQ